MCNEEIMMKKNLRAYLGFLLSPVLTLILTESYLYHPFTDMSLNPWLLNISFYWLLAALLWLLTGRLRLALRIQTVFFMLAGLANYYVVAFRSSPILPWDIFSIGTAAEVADNFSYALPPRCMMLLLCFLLLLAVQHFCDMRIQRWSIRLLGSVASFGLLAAMTVFLHQDATIAKLRLYDKMFTPDVVQKRNGTAVAFLMELRYLLIQKPEGYQAKECGELLADYGEADFTEVQEGKKPPKIIVIMDEAFSDIADVGDFTSNEDYLPFYHRMEQDENTITGRLHVSVLGGNTANTEFEFLTGNTMAFLPHGSVPYQQYVRGELPSLASYLGEAGYASLAMHPYYAKGWNRSSVYPFMGFEDTCFLDDDYQNAVYVRKYVSDASDFERIIQAYETRDQSRPLFIFNVTMQNHGGYDQTYDNFEQPLFAEGISSQPLSAYLSLIRLTDDALSELVSYFSQEEEDTMIVFFGDHQPNDTVPAPIWQADGLQKSAFSEKQEQARYQVPFLIWANFEIDAAHGVQTSANYLAVQVLKQAGLPVGGYYAYLEELQKEFPIITAKQITSAGGEELRGLEKDTEALMEYQRFQYYQMFDAPQVSAAANEE